jgi:hypothetical protein
MAIAGTATKQSTRSSARTNRSNLGGRANISQSSTFVKASLIKEMNARIRSQLTTKYKVTVEVAMHTVVGPNGETDECWADMTLVLGNGLHHTIHGEPTTDGAIAFNHALENAIAWIDQLGTVTTRSVRAAA